MESTPTTPEGIWYVAYGAYLHPKLLAARLGGTHKPLERKTVSIASALLSFDFKGVPGEPCYSNAIIKGVNDLEGRELARMELGVEVGVEVTVGQIEGTTAYREWIWARCCPGLEFTGELPPCLEAVALKLSPEHFHQVMSPISSRSTPRNDSPNTAYELHEVECIVFEQGDQDKITGKLIASIPIVVDPRYTAPNLMPTLRYLRLVLIGSFFSTLSQPFLGHLVLLRNHDPTTESFSRRLLGTFYTILLLPPFLLYHLPTILAKRLGMTLTGRRRALVANLVYGLSQRVERLMEGRKQNGIGSN